MTKRRIAYFGGLFACLAGALFFSTPLFAKTINFEVSADRNRVSLGSSGQLYLTFNNTQDMPVPELPDSEGFQFRYVGPSTRMSVINGQVSSSITHTYNLFPLKTGNFKIGPLKFEYKGDEYISNPVSIEVLQGPVQQPADNPQPGVAPGDISDRIFLVMQIEKNRLYLNESVPVTIKLYVNKLAVRDIQFPAFSHEGFSVGEFAQPKQYQEVFNGVNYEVIEFSTAIFGLRPGEFRLGPANLKCNLMVRRAGNRRASAGFDDFFGSDVFDDFFGRYDTFALDLKAPEIPVTVAGLPEESKPADFSGAVGDFDLGVSIKPSEVKVGDPITLMITVSGTGNFNTVTLPRLSSGAGFKIYEPQVKQEPGKKTFEQVVMPLSENIKEVPQIVFSFFDPRTGTYRSLSRGPLPITVLKPEKEEAARIVENPQGAGASVREEKLGRDIIFIKETAGKFSRRGGYLYKNQLFLWLQLIPVLGFLFFFVLQRMRIRLKTDIRYARRLAAPKKARQGLRRIRLCLESGKAKEFHDAVFQTLQEYLGDKFHLPSQSITVSILEVLKKEGAGEEALIKMREIFDECDMARYSVAAFDKESMEKTVNKLEEVIDYFQKQKV